MASRTSSPLTKSPVVITFLVFAVTAFLALARDVLRPLALAMLLAFALAPLVRYIQHRGIPRIAAVLLVMAMTLGLLVTGTYLVGRQFITLVGRIPAYEKNILEKLHWLRASEPEAISRATQAVEHMAASLRGEGERQDEAVMNVRIVEGAWPQDLGGMVSPYLEILGTALIVLVLVLFLLANPANLMERIIRLVGQSRISVTMQTLDELGSRISRYLATFACVNILTGLTVGLALWAVGVEFAALWGILSATLRFIPYLGPIFAFLSPVVFSVASSSGWWQPVLVGGIILAIEVINDTVVEPLAYGKSAGVSPLALLVAAVFWAWIWGPLGLLLSTALTVSLSVLGKYVRELQFLDILLGEGTKLSDDMKFYQYMLMMDEDGAWEVLEPALRRRPLPEVFDAYLVPALARTKRDAAREYLEDRDEAFIYRTIEDLAEETSAGEAPAVRARALGVPTQGAADTVALRMLGELMAPLGVELTVLDASATPLQVAGKVQEEEPDFVVISRVAPGGGVHARYLLRRLRAQHPELPLLLGQWAATDADGESARAAKEAGATAVVATMTAALEWAVKNTPAAGPGATDPAPATGGKRPEVLL